MSEDNRFAPEGTIWVCGACGQHGKDRYEIGDESCLLNAVLCVDDKPELVSPFHHKWTAAPARAAKEGGE
jgi:hypothetical protein